MRCIFSPRVSMNQCGVGVRCEGMFRGFFLNKLLRHSAIWKSALSARYPYTEEQCGVLQYCSTVKRAPNGVSSAALAPQIEPTQAFLFPIHELFSVYISSNDT